MQSNGKYRVYLDLCIVAMTFPDSMARFLKTSISANPRLKCVPQTPISANPGLRWLPPVLHFPEPLNFTKGFLAHHDGLVRVRASLDTVYTYGVWKGLEV